MNTLYQAIIIVLFPLWLMAETVPTYVIFENNRSKFQRVGYPNFLKQLPNFEFIYAVPSFNGSLQRVGSGVHIGEGRILTCRHVYAILVPQVETAKFKGKKIIRPGRNESDLLLLQLPQPNQHDLDVIERRTAITWDKVGFYNDWTLLQDNAYSGHFAFSQMRSATALRPGEPLWIFGHPYGGNPPGQIAVGNFSQNLGIVSVINDTDLMKGFSGGPVVDTNGNLVGVICTYNPETRQATFMNVDEIYKTIGSK